MKISRQICAKYLIIPVLSRVSARLVRRSEGFWTSVLGFLGFTGDLSLGCDCEGVLLSAASLHYPYPNSIASTSLVEFPNLQENGVRSLVS